MEDSGQEITGTEGEELDGTTGQEVGGVDGQLEEIAEVNPVVPVPIEPVPIDIEEIGPGGTGGPPGDIILSPIDGFIKSKETLKTFFQKGDIPEEDQFADLIDAFRHMNDGHTITDVSTAPNGIISITLSNGTVVAITPPVNDEYVPKTGGGFTGHVGVGTETPGAILEVKGTFSPTRPHLAINTVNDHVSLSLQHLGVDKGSIWYNADIDKMAFGKGISARHTLFIDGNDNFGIGTNDPQKKLHIDGGVVRIQSPSGHADIGSINNTAFHFQTGLPKFWFDKEVLAHGNLGLSTKDTYMRFSDGAIFENNQRVATQSWANSQGFLKESTATNYVRKDRNENNAFFDDYLIFNYNTTSDVDAISFNPNTNGFYFNAARGKNKTHANADIYVNKVIAFNDIATAESVHVAGNVYAGAGSQGSSYFGDGKEIIRFNDGWLRLNPSTTAATRFGTGIYCGASKLRTDGQFEIGSEGNKFKVTSGGTVTAAGNIYSNGESYFGDGKRVIRFDDGWLRINPDSAFTAGIYCGTGKLRTDGQLEVGSSGNKFKVTTSGTVTAAGALTVGGNMSMTLGDGKGVRFWGHDNYKIYMSSATNGTWGGRVSGDTTSDYNMYFRMTGGTNRGFVFKNDHNEVAGIDASGNARFNGTIYEGGTALSNKYLGKTAKAADSNKLDGIDSSGFVRDGVDEHRSWNNEYLIFTHNGADNVDAISYDDANNAFHFNADRSKTKTSSNAKVYAGALYEGGTALTSKYLGKTAKAVDSEKVDGINGASLLRSDANDTFTGTLAVGSTSTRQAGIYGIYDSTKVGHIWSIGTNYKISQTGVNFGNLYGFAYKHTNNPTGGTMAGGHQAIWCKNGAPRVALGDNIWTSGTIYAAGSITSAGNVTAYSDKRLKTAFKPIQENILDKIDQLKPTFYQWKDQAKDQARQLGFIAQEVKDVFPEWVHENEEYYSMSYDKMGAVLAVQGIQELRAEIKSLKEELKTIRDGFTK
ncbi:tail fiber domain-containing protein [uncultured Dokdonia sp.]|uniref:tail fiber domain-containing protein n=1 Tax=uncultured Dokdonia sp. TaxID=575653 RepID=UPI0026387653|nr:tail fiber domain-containing protein [uncultured Dokdonia sp.]